MEVINGAIGGAEIAFCDGTNAVVKAVRIQIACADLAINQSPLRANLDAFKLLSCILYQDLAGSNVDPRMEFASRA